jgi:hypothetical protein
MALQAAAMTLPIAPLAKFALVTSAAAPLTFMLASRLRRPFKI